MEQVLACRQATQATQGDSVLERLRGGPQPQQPSVIPGMEFEVKKKKPAKKASCCDYCGCIAGCNQLCLLPTSCKGVLDWSCVSASQRLMFGRHHAHVRTLSLQKSKASKQHQSEAPQEGAAADGKPAPKCVDSINLINREKNWVTAADCGAHTSWLQELFKCKWSSSFVFAVCSLCPRPKQWDERLRWRCRQHCVRRYNLLVGGQYSSEDETDDEVSDAEGSGSEAPPGTGMHAAAGMHAHDATSNA
eukprot:1158383-Pelagomonas_calceolata.AAC.2